jgi:hypothetical protein
MHARFEIAISGAARCSIMNTQGPSFRVYLNGPRSVANFTGVRVEAITLEELLRRVVGWSRDKVAPARHVGCINARRLVDAYRAALSFVRIVDNVVPAVRMPIQWAGLT